MRLIDKDALMETLGIAHDCSFCRNKNGLFCKKHTDFVYACGVIANAPVIETPTESDAISRQAAIDAVNTWLELYALNRTTTNTMSIQDILRTLPSAQPERTCVNCGRTANNGGWYADGGTRCPIEEHYALPKDGYCHLWEKRNVTDDDYPERRTDE